MLIYITSKYSYVLVLLLNIKANLRTAGKKHDNLIDAYCLESLIDHLNQIVCVCVCGQSPGRLLQQRQIVAAN